VKWPELVHRETGERHSFNTLTKPQLAYYIAHGSGGWVQGSSDQPGASVDVRKRIAAKLLEQS
jgi:hypothetical protein